MRGEECFDGTAGSPGTGLNLKLLQVAFILSEKHDIESHSICSISTCTFNRIEVKGEKTCFGLRRLHHQPEVFYELPPSSPGGIWPILFVFPQAVWPHRGSYGK